MKHIIRNCFRIICRSGLFRFSILFMCVFVLGVQLFLQGDCFQHVLTGLNEMPSFIAYENQRLGTILLVFFLFFWIKELLGVERRSDAREVVYARSESNRELLGGYFTAVLASAFVGGVLIGLAGMCVHLFSFTPFALFPYLFYFFTLTLPALVFYAGLAFGVYVVIRNLFVGLIILLSLFFLNLCCVDGLCGGVFDPLGAYLPNALSGVTGHPDVVPYLLQRFCWLLLGIGGFWISVWGFERIPDVWRWRGVLLVVSVVAGVVAGGLCYGDYREGRKTLERYREVYEIYAERESVTVERNDMRVRLEGDRMRGECRMRLVNRTGKVLPEVLLYLNPHLEVLGVKDEQGEISVQRECQVVRLRREMVPADTMEIVVRYAGGIDESVCYLDVPDREREGVGRSYFLNCRYGKHYAYLSREFTLLLPECLWYPVAALPVNPVNPYRVTCPFADYTLAVSGQGKRKVVSQGKRYRQGDEVVFRPETPLQGMSLCVGDYQIFGTTVDSVRYEVLVFRKNVNILKGLSHVQLKNVIRGLMDQAEKLGGSVYPYARFMLIETPLSFASYYRGQRGGAEFVQPEMLFVPERGTGYWKNVLWQKRRNITVSRNIEVASGGAALGGGMYHRLTREEQENEIVKCFLENFLFNRDVSVERDWNNDNLKVWRPKEAVRYNERRYEMNLYTVEPLFGERLKAVANPAEGVLGTILHHMMKRERGEIVLKMRGRMLMSEDEAYAYLREHSLEEAMSDGSLSWEVREDIFALKTEELYKLFAYRGVQSPELFACVDSILRQAVFREIDLERLKREMRVCHGTDWDSVLEEWFGQKRVPTYLLKRFQVRQVKDDQQVEVDVVNFSLDDIWCDGRKLRHRYRVNLEVYNDSDVDGLIVLRDVRNKSMDDYRVFSGDCRQEIVELKAGEGKIIEWEYDDFRPELDFGLSWNLPRVYYSNNYSGSEVTDRKESRVIFAEREYFTGRGDPHAIVVDNEDTTFCVREERSFRLRDVFGGGTERECTEFGFPEEQVWKRAVADGVSSGRDLFGSPVASAMYKLAGSGELSAQWETEVQEEGTYEIFAYVYHLASWGIRKKVDRTREEKNKLTYRQYYTVKNGEEVYEVSTETNDRWKQDSWYSLGEFPLKAGAVEVILWDKGETEDQVIVADAVKFVFKGE